jgi:hypothetical protein
MTAPINRRRESQLWGTNCATQPRPVRAMASESQHNAMSAISQRMARE